MPPNLQTAPAITARVHPLTSPLHNRRDKGGPIGIMLDSNELNQAESKNLTPQSSPETANSPETPSRRELIERYGKYAVVAAPLLVFVSKARAIHSKP